METPDTYTFPEDYAPPETWMQNQLDDLNQQGRLRTLQTAEPLAGGRIRINGQTLLNLCSNDYLGLLEGASTPPLATGSGASRLISGNHPGYTELETQLAELHGSQACLVFGSGFLANLGVITALTDRHDVIFSDKLNHASIVDGATLSRAKHVRYRHNDLDHLEAMLVKHTDARRRLIVTDAVFSMDGDCADLTRLVELKYRYGAMLMIDEAHSGGAMGPAGAGLSAELGVSEHIDIHMGTLSKAFACYGAYVCTSEVTRNYLINHARPLIYSTSLPPAAIAAAIQNTDRVRHADALRRQLKANSQAFRSELLKFGLDCGPGTTHIVPLILGDDRLVLTLSDRLRSEGIAAWPIRPPTVPVNSSRIRFSIMASHQPADLLSVANVLSKLVKCQ